MIFYYSLSYLTKLPTVDKLFLNMQSLASTMKKTNTKASTKKILIYGVEEKLRCR